MNDGKKRKAPKHQNKTAFKIQFNPLALQIHKKVSLKGLCKRCSEQITWKLTYNKYKKMSQPAKCNFCLQKNVLRTYMRACQKCYQQKNVCPKCLQTETEEQIQLKLNEIQQKKADIQSEKKMNDFLKTLKQRSRRTVKRLYQKGTITWNDELNNFEDEEGNILNVQYRNGYGDKANQQIDESYDEFGDDCGSQQQIQQNDEQIKDSQQQQIKENQEQQITGQNLNENQDEWQDVQQNKQQTENKNKKNKQKKNKLKK